jgi:hypothetical protein
VGQAPMQTLHPLSQTAALLKQDRVRMYVED